MLLFAPFDLEDLIETREQRAVSTLPDELFRPAVYVSARAAVWASIAYLADSFLSMSRSFLTTSMSSCVLDVATRRLQYRCGEIAVSFFFSFAALGASMGRSGERIESIDPPRPECCAARGDRKRSYSSMDCFCVGRGGLVVELMECVLCALRKAWGVGGGISGVLPLESVCDDLTIAAFTDDSIPASFGRSEGGT